MKLKKFAAMMLAGVMAVSMLAGCSGKGTNGGNDGDGVVVEPSSSSIVTAFNDAQEDISFSSDSKLNTLLTNAVELTRDNAGAIAVLFRMGQLTGPTGREMGTLAADKFFTVQNETDGEIKNGMTKEMINVVVYSSNDYWTEADAVNAAAREIKQAIEDAELLKDTKEGKNDGDKYFEFGYTGNVSMVKAETVNGATNYYVAYTVTQTATEKTVSSK